METAIQISDKLLPEEMVLLPVENSIENAVLEFSFYLNPNAIIDYASSHKQEFEKYLADMAAKGLSFD